LAIAPFLGTFKRLIGCLRCGHQAANLLDGERQDYALIPTVISSTFLITDVNYAQEEG